MSHRWEIKTSDGETYIGENNFPKDEIKRKASVFVLSLQNNRDVLVIPPDCKLVFFRRNRIDFSLDGDENRTYFYIIGYKGAKKELYKISLERDGTISKTKIESDGRPD